MNVGDWTPGRGAVAEVTANGDPMKEINRGK